MTSPTSKRVRRWLLVIVLLAVSIPFASLAVLSAISSRPNNLGVQNGKLAPCPDSPNCVSTFAESGEHSMPAIPWSGDAATAVSQLKNVISKQPRAEVVTASENYLHAEFTSAVFRFVDDVEFLIDTDAGLIHFRSASRIGRSDMGANRKRMERLTAAMTMLD